jgi:hypothetical protein
MRPEALSFAFPAIPAMGFDSQTTGQPLVNVRKRTTKVNLAIVVSVLVFVVIGVLYAVRVSKKSAKGEVVLQPPAPAS